MNWVQQEKLFFIPVAKRLPVEVVRGDGVFLYDRRGRAYLDFLSGIAVNALGYRHPRVMERIAKQLERNAHLSHFFIQDIQLEFSRKLLKLSGFSRVFLTNSGTESIEGLLKLVKKWGRQQGRGKIIAFQNSFHGRTLGALSITGQEKYQKNFRPLLPDVQILPFNDGRSLREAADEKTSAIFLEIIQGEGGIRPVNREFVAEIKRAQNSGVLIVADEIQTGAGRTGTFLAGEQFGLKPDLVAMAKAIGGGLPLGAFLVSEPFASVFDRGEHGSTFGGNPVACAAGLAVLEELADHGLLKQVAENGKYLGAKLAALQQTFPRLITEVRGAGLMYGVQLAINAPVCVELGLKEGIILNITGGGSVLRLVPPLIITRDEIDLGMERIARVLSRLESPSPSQRSDT